MPEQFILPILPTGANTFETFVSEGNALACGAARHWVEGRLQQLYLWGAPGSGVSHLLEAMAAACDGILLSCQLLKEQGPGILHGLEQYPRLLLDDLDCLAGDPDWEEALFHLYNRIRAANGALALGAAQPPSALAVALPDLRTRLAADTVFRVDALDEPGLQAMARRWALNRGLDIGDDVLGFLLLRLPRDARVWKQVLAQLDRQSLTQQRRITIPFVRSLCLEGEQEIGAFRGKAATKL